MAYTYAELETIEASEKQEMNAYYLACLFIKGKLINLEHLEDSLRREVLQLVRDYYDERHYEDYEVYVNI